MQLKEREIHIWSAPLRPLHNTCTMFYALLSPQEQARAQTFAFDVLQKNFIAARAVLRLLLSQYMCCHPKAIVIAYTSYGKPYVIGNDGRVPIQFNLSHMSDHVIYAFHSTIALGIDIENTQREYLDNAVIDTFCSLAEKEHLNSLEEKQRNQAALQLWTCKEAYLKALGCGLSKCPRTVEFDLLSPTEIKFKIKKGDVRDNTQWLIYPIRHLENSVGALVMPIFCFQPISIHLHSFPIYLLNLTKGLTNDIFNFK